MTFTDNIQDMIDDFSFLEDWEDRYMHVIEMGRSLAPLREDERNKDTKVNGCTSQVWLVFDRDNNRLVIRGDSDAHIVKGLVAIVIEIFSGRTPEEIEALDGEAIIHQLGLSEHLSTQRANGLRSMINRVKSSART